MSEPIYKICDEVAWAEAQARGVYAGSTDDARDGFIHFSTGNQLAGTAARHFAGEENLVLVAVDPASLGEALRWEASRGGALFPHLYGALEAGAVVSVQPLPLGDDGIHRFPEGIAP